MRRCDCARRLLLHLSDADPRVGRSASVTRARPIPAPRTPLASNAPQRALAGPRLVNWWAGRPTPSRGTWCDSTKAAPPTGRDTPRSIRGSKPTAFGPPRPTHDFSKCSVCAMQRMAWGAAPEDQRVTGSKNRSQAGTHCPKVGEVGLAAVAHGAIGEVDVPRVARIRGVGSGRPIVVGDRRPEDWIDAGGSAATPRYRRVQDGTQFRDRWQPLVRRACEKA